MLPIKGSYYWRLNQILTNTWTGWWSVIWRRHIVSLCRCYWISPWWGQSTLAVWRWRGVSCWWRIQWRRVILTHTSMNFTFSFLFKKLFLFCLKWKKPVELCSNGRKYLSLFWIKFLMVINEIWLIPVGEGLRILLAQDLVLCYHVQLWLE